MYPKFSQSHLYSLYRKHTSLKRKKDSDEVRKTNCGDQRNCGNRLEKEIKKKKFFFKKKESFVKNYKNKNTQTNKLIISTMSKETNLSEI